MEDKACKTTPVAQLTHDDIGLLATVIARMESEGIETQEFASRNGKGFLKK